MTIDNYVNDQMRILSEIGRKYDFQMDKYKFQFARNEIKHFIQGAGAVLKKQDYDKFADYCRLTFEKYLPEVV